ncbi:MAG: serine/threonine protein kinase, partial [Lapillicoccus sp.]
GGDNTAYALMPRIRSLPVPATGRPDVPASLERVLAQAMAKDPAHRPARAVDLARQLQAVEQELRLPRTPLVVLDQSDQPDQPDQPGGIGGTDDGGDGATGDDDRTRVKNVQQVRAQSSGAFVPTPDTLAEPPDTHQGRHPFVLALAAVAVLLVIVGFLVLRPTGEPAPSPVPSRTAVATQSATTDSAIGDGVFAAPAVTGTPKVGSVEFAWSYAAPRSTDTYRVHVGPTPGDAQIADPVTVPKATYAVKVASGSTMCLVATVVRSGQISPASPAVCATAL